MSPASDATLAPLLAGKTSVVLLDIEGTTTPITFVYDVLFPFARTHLAAFVIAHGTTEAVARDLAALRQEHAFDLDAGRMPPVLGDGPEAVVPYCHWLMDQDRKLTPLKSLQGRIWEDGYTRGELKGVVYDDVAPALRRWTTSGRRVAIYSSGSVLAQRLLFQHSTAGDLTPFLSAHFDTTTGHKTDPLSYRALADALAAEPAHVAFVSDVVAELDAARDAGLGTILIVRPGNPPQPRHAHREVASFPEL